MALIPKLPKLLVFFSRRGGRVLDRYSVLTQEAWLAPPSSW